MPAIVGTLGISAANAPDWVLGLLIAQVALLLIGIATWRRAAGLSRRWDVLLKDASGKDIQSMLEHHLDTAQEHEGRLGRLERQAKALETHLTRSVRRAGIVKYDAFPDIGGEQSFALALLDDGGDGVVLTSIVGRADNRVFAKPIKGGRASVTLTSEEEAALAAAGRWD